MTRITLTRRLVAATLLAAFPFATATAIATPAPAASPISQASSVRLSNLKSKGSTEIDRRLLNLTAAGAKLESAGKLSATDKAALLKQLSDESTSLTALKTKLAAETTLPEARADVQSIVADYRVYALMLPKARLVATADRLIQADDKLSALSIQLAEKVAAAKAAGKDVGAVESKVSSLKLRLSSVKPKLDPLPAELLALTPKDYNADHSVLVSYRTKLASSATELKAAREEAKAIVALLAGLSTTN